MWERSEALRHGLMVAAHECAEIGPDAIFALKQKLNARAILIDDDDVGQAISIEVSRAWTARVPVQLHDLWAVKIQVISGESAGGENQEGE